jgi:hypothetical protein
MSNSGTRPVVWQEAGARQAVAFGPRTPCVRLAGRQAARHWSVPRSCVCALTVILALLLTELLSGCGGGAGGGSQQSAQTTSSGLSQAPGAAVVAQAWTGHYVGTVKIADVTYFSDAVFTQDGAVRLYVGGPYDNGGELQDTRPESSEQLVGTVEMHDGQLSGSGLIIGQECAINAANQFCGQPSPAAISTAVQLNTDGPGSAVIQGNIQVVTAGGMESWALDLQLWSDPDPGTSIIPGQFQETLAEFASGGDVIVSFDSSGRFFFQSATTGCVGNGTSVARPDGTSGTFDVTLLMGNCTGTYAYLNGMYDGLAVYTSSSYWDYDVRLRVWLSKPSGELPAAAITMLSD